MPSKRNSLFFSFRKNNNRASSSSSMKKASSESEMKRQDSHSGSFNESETFTLHDYEFDFNNCMKMPEVKELFGKFLHSEYNGEPIQFIDAVHEFREEISRLHDEHFAKQRDEVNLKSFNDIHQVFKKKSQAIIDDFLSPRAIKEINIAAEVKRNVIKSYEELNEAFDLIMQDKDSELLTSSMSLKQNQYHIFSNVQSQLMVELAMDVFPRFIRSNMWKSFINKQSESVVKKIGYKKDAKKLRELLYTYEDWVNPMITDHDFEFNRRMTEDSSNWSIITTHNSGNNNNHNGYSIYEQSTLYMMKNEFIIGDNLPPELRNRTLAKIVLYLPYHYKYVAETITSKWIEGMDKMTLETEHFDYTHSDVHAGRKYATTFYVSRMKFGPEFILDRRELFLSASMLLDPQDPDNIIYVSRDLKPMRDKSKGWERASSFILYRFQRITDQLTRFTSVYSVNMGGKMKKVGGFVNKGVMKKRVKVLRDSMMKAHIAREEMERREGVNKLESNGKFDTLVENTRNLAHLYDDSSIQIRSAILGESLLPRAHSFMNSPSPSSQSQNETVEELVDEVVVVEVKENDEKGTDEVDHE